MCRSWSRLGSWKLGLCPRGRSDSDRWLRSEHCFIHVFIHLHFLDWSSFLSDVSTLHSSVNNAGLDFDHVDQWSCAQVSMWLTEAGFAKYAQLIAHDHAVIHCYSRIFFKTILGNIQIFSRGQNYRLFLYVFTQKFIRVSNFAKKLECFLILFWKRCESSLPF